MRSLGLIIAVCLACTVHIQSSASEKATVHPLSSKILAETPSITVYLPHTYARKTKPRYPVLYVLDGKLNASLVSSMLRRMHFSKGANEHIVIGVESANRLFDFAPTVNRDPRGPVGQGGGGDPFLDFMQTELMPEIDQKYRTINQNVIAGHSIAGLIVMHAFYTRPDLFQAHLTFSPAVWWGARETAKATQQYVISDKSIKGYLYMNIGNESGEMRDVYDALERTILRNRTLDLSFKTGEFKHEDHDFTMTAGLYDALKGLYQYQSKMRQ